MSEYDPAQGIGAVVARLRTAANLTQSTLAEMAGLDQSRISRIEKGEVVASADVDRVLDTLAKDDVSDAASFKAFLAREWKHIEPPLFWNPQRACLEIAEETLAELEEFLSGEARPWPLRRQLEKHRNALMRGASFLGRLNHNIAFIGDQGVGKSTAISFIFDLLVPLSLVDKPINRPVLETGGGGTTICEVHIKSGPEFGISLLPMSETEIRELTSDFCAAKWASYGKVRREPGENISVSREAERAIRNMSKLLRRTERVDGKIIHHDPIVELAKASSTEEEFRARVLQLMAIDERTQRELWYDSSTRKNPMEWITETFKKVNNGRLDTVSLPKSIDLLIPNFGRSFGELEISVVDTKGVDDVAVREDLDLRLKDARTAVVFCSRFNDAPGTSARVLLQHMRQTFSERFDTGKVSILSLPRAEEARAMKDDVGEQALTDIEGYEFKRMQVTTELNADDLAGVPTMFYNVELDDPVSARGELFSQLSRMRKSVEDRLFDLCAAIQDIAKNHEEEAFNAALEVVANRLSTFLKGNRELGAREQLAHVEAIKTIKSVRYASTLWAATRRNGDYSGLNVLHLVGVGAARDARLRSDTWFNSLDAFLKSLKADDDLALALRSIDQIAASADVSKRAFLDAVQRGGMEVYREPLSQSSIWVTCASEWGMGPGFTQRVARHLEGWFSKETGPKDNLEAMIKGMWERMVIAPLVRLTQENAPDSDTDRDNVVQMARPAYA